MSMIKLCDHHIAQLTKIHALKTQLTNEFGSLSNHQISDRKEQSDELNKFFRLRSQLRNLIKEIIKELSKVSVEQAEKLIGKNNFFGPKEIRKAFNFKNEIDPREIPEIGFTKEELERAKELKQFLVLRMDKAPDGDPLTMKKIMELKGNKTTDGGNLLFDTSAYKNRDFYIKEPVKLTWALVTREIVESTTNKNYLQQYDVLIAYLKNEVFKNQALPKEYQEAIEEYNDKKAQIESIDKLGDDWQTAATQLQNLKITKLLRRTPAEILYDLVVVADGKPNGQKLLSKTYIYSSRGYSGFTGYFVSIGDFDAAGVRIDRDTTNHSNDILGACFSRNASVL